MQALELNAANANGGLTELSFDEISAVSGAMRTNFERERTSGSAGVVAAASGFTAAAIGLGAAIGTVGGPVGTAIGAAAGAFVGATMDLILWLTHAH